MKEINRRQVLEGLIKSGMGALALSLIGCKGLKDVEIDSQTPKGGFNILVFETDKDQVELTLEVLNEAPWNVIIPLYSLEKLGWNPSRDTARDYNPTQEFREFSNFFLDEKLWKESFECPYMDLDQVAWVIIKNDSKRMVGHMCFDGKTLKWDKESPNYKFLYQDKHYDFRHEI